MLGINSLVDVIFTKWDLIESHGGGSDLEAYIAHVQADMKARFESRVRRLRFFRVAARPEKGSELPFAHGLSEVFPSWVEETRTPTVARSQALKEPYWTGEFDRYLLTRMPHISMADQV